VCVCVCNNVFNEGILFNTLAVYTTKSIQREVSMHYKINNVYNNVIPLCTYTCIKQECQ